MKWGSKSGVVLACGIAISMMAATSHAATVLSVTFNDGSVSVTPSAALPSPDGTNVLTTQLVIQSVDTTGAAAVRTLVSLNTGAGLPAFALTPLTLTGNIDVVSGQATGLINVSDGTQTLSLRLTSATVIDTGIRFKLDASIGGVSGALSGSPFGGVDVASILGLPLVGGTFQMEFSGTDLMSGVKIKLEPGPVVAVPITSSIWSGLVLLGGAGMARLYGRRKKVA